MKRRLIVLLAVSLFAAACGSSSPTAPPATVPAASTVQTIVFSFSADLSSFTQAGATAQATAIGILTNGRTQDVTATCVNWQSNNPSALTVNSGGLMTAQSSSGSATITTTCQGVSASGLVVLNPPPSVPPTPKVSATPSPPY